MRLRREPSGCGCARRASGRFAFGFRTRAPRDSPPSVQRKLPPSPGMTQAGEELQRFIDAAYEWQTE